MPRPNRGAHIYWNREKGLYYARWYEQGRPFKRSTGTTDSREAQAFLARLIADQQRATGNRGGPRDPSDILISEVLDLYLTEQAPEQEDSARSAYAVSALLPFWQTLTVGQITRETCRGYGRYRQRAVSTVRRELTTLRAAVNYAHGEGVITRPVTVHMPQAPKGKERWLTRFEAAQLLNAARHARSDVRLYLPLFIKLALYSGARKEAILSLRWPQVKLKSGRINFARVDDEGNILPETSKKRAHNHIPTRLLSALRCAYKRRDSDLGFVVHDKGKQILDIGGAWKGDPTSRGDGSFGSACKRAGLVDVTPHTLRHTCGTWLAQAGVPLHEIGGFLGHTDERTTRLYAHHHPDHQKNVADAFTGRRGRK